MRDRPPGHVIVAGLVMTLAGIAYQLTLPDGCSARGIPDEWLDGGVQLLIGCDNKEPLLYVSTLLVLGGLALLVAGILLTRIGSRAHDWARRRAVLLLGMGVLAIAMGWWLRHSLAGSARACEVAAIIADADLPDTPPAPRHCGWVSAGFEASPALVLLGAMSALAGWLAGATSWLARVSRQLHIKPRGLAWLAVALLFGISLTVRVLWVEHEQAADEQRRTAATRSLASLHPPALLRASPSSPCASQDRCWHTPLEPTAVYDDLLRLLDGQQDYLTCALAPDPFGQPCLPPIRGSVAGYPASAVVSRHLVTVPAGTNPPAGAVPVRPGSKHLYFLGSDVTIALNTPEGT